MKIYESNEELINAIRNSFNKYLSEFSHVSEDDKNKIINGVDKTPSQNISYQLGWVNLLLKWESDEKAERQVIMPKVGFKWNNLGALYQEFYQEYGQHSLNENTVLLSSKVDEVIDWVQSLTNDELFLLDQRKWATTPAQWPVYKWIHINTVAPFTNFRMQIRKWKRLQQQPY